MKELVELIAKSLVDNPVKTYEGASDYESEGRGFKSLRAYYFIFNNPIISKVLGPSISFEMISGRRLTMTQGQEMTLFLS